MKLTSAFITAVLVFSTFSLAQAADLTDAQNTVNSIREADLPQVSTSTKESPVGQPISDYKPEGPSSAISEVPSPVNKNNPQNDPDVQRGYDEHQAQYNSD